MRVLLSPAYQLELDPKQAQIVELRYFGGLSIEETAEVMQVSPATVKREWAGARTWLRRELDPGLELPRVEPGEAPVSVMYSRHVGQQVKQTAPTGWTYAQVQFREVGDHAECTALVRDLAGRMFQWAPPQAVTERFRETRQSMTGPQTTWYSARLDVEYSGRENLQFNRTDEPQWITPPPPEAYQEELRRAGSADVVPDWLRARLDELGN